MRTMSQRTAAVPSTASRCNLKALGIRPFVAAVPLHWRQRRSLNSQASDRVVAAAAPEAAEARKDEEQPFMDQMRAYAMALHTREQAPREGKAEAPSQGHPRAWTPTKEGYLAFLAESRVVYAAFEDIMASTEVPYFSEFVNTGLERVAALDADISYMVEHWGMPQPHPAADGPGATYAAKLRQLAASSPTAYICHYYNFYFAHTAGGRMIGAQVSKAALEGWTGEFYRWEGDVRALLGEVREKLNSVAAQWSKEEKEACLQETPATFKASGELLKLIAGQSGA